MIRVPDDLTGKELIAFLKANKSELLSQKCAFFRKSDPRDLPYQTHAKQTAKKSWAKKTAGETTVVIDDNGELPITAIANTANWIDSQMDMLLPGCWKKTIKESGPAGKNRIYHLHDHNQMITGVIGKITDLYPQNIALSDLGIDGAVGQTECLVMESVAKEKLNDQCFDMYTDKMINQHSIGMQYVKIDLAINDPNSPAEFAVWNKYFSQVINKDVATKCGYFYVVYEIKLLEVSAVLWGSNELTGCIEDESEDEDLDQYGQPMKKTQPPVGTENNNEPDNKSTQPDISEMISKTEIVIKL